MTRNIEKMKAPVVVVVAFVVAVTVLFGCSDNSDQQGSTQQQSSGLVQSVEQDVTKAETFKKMFLDFPNPGPTGPASSDTAGGGGAPLSGDTSLIPKEE